MDINFYFTPTDSFLYEFFKTIVFSIIASTIFWWFEIYRPRIKSSEISVRARVYKHVCPQIEQKTARIKCE